jgi:hypothetical protein
MIDIIGKTSQRHWDLPKSGPGTNGKIARILTTVIFGNTTGLPRVRIQTMSEFRTYSFSARCRFSASNNSSNSSSVMSGFRLARRVITTVAIMTVRFSSRGRFGLQEHQGCRFRFDCADSIRGRIPDPLRPMFSASWTQKRPTVGPHRLVVFLRRFQSPTPHSLQRQLRERSPRNLARFRRLKPTRPIRRPTCSACGTADVVASRFSALDKV